MKMCSTDRSSRRELLVEVLRYATLGMLGAAGGSASFKRGRLVREGKCVNGEFVGVVRFLADAACRRHFQPKKY
jgi:hypothetical protein